MATDDDRDLAVAPSPAQPAPASAAPPLGASEAVAPAHAEAAISAAIAAGDLDLTAIHAQLVDALVRDELAPLAELGGLGAFSVELNEMLRGDPTLAALLSPG